jgi:RNA polymerase sigma-70 factor (ECF subfamily)
MLHETNDVASSTVSYPVDGARPSFESLFETYSGPLYSYAYRMVGNTEDAHDLTQDAFIKIYQALPRLRPANVRAWVYRIATNVCLDALRHRRLVRWQSLDALLEAERRRGRDEWALRHAYQTPAPRGESRPRGKPGMASRVGTAGSAAPTEPLDPQQHVLHWECSSEVRRALDRLYVHYRAALILREFYGLSHEEIGVVLDLPRGAVKSLVSRARKEFRQVWSEQGAETSGSFAG